MHSVPNDKLFFSNFTSEAMGYDMLHEAVLHNFPLSVEVFYPDNKKIRYSEIFLTLEGLSCSGVYFLVDEYERVIDTALSQLFTTPKKIEDNHKETYRLNEQYFKIAKSCKFTDYSRFSDKEIGQMLKRIYSIMRKSHANSLVTTWSIDSVDERFSKKLMSIVDEHIVKSKSKLDKADVFSILTTKPENSLQLQEESESWSIVKKICEDEKSKEAMMQINDMTEIPTEINEDLRRDMIVHLEKWRWMPFTYLGPAYDLDYYLAIWSGVLKEKQDPIKRIAELKKRPAKLRLERKKLFSRLSMTKKMQRVFEIAADIAFLKGYRKDAIFYGCYVLSFIYREISRRRSLAMNQIHLMTQDELLDMMLKDENPDLEEINKRNRKTVLIYLNGSTRILYDNDADEYLKNKNIREQLVDLTARELKGTTACSGSAKGNVRIVNNPSQMSKMKQGDIMVSHTTYPALVPAMKIASAIVTEDGGITCHAAIVSRELKIPCVTGVRTATKILKDGDYVEVDASNGIVTKVDKKIGIHDSNPISATKMNHEWLLGEDIPDIDLFFSQIWLSCFTDEFRSPSGLAYSKVRTIYRGYHLWFYFDRDDSNNVGKNIVDRFIKDPDFAVEVNNQIIKQADKLRRFSEALPENGLDIMSNNDIWKHYADFDRIHTDYYRWCWIPVAADMFHDNLTNALKDYLRTKKISAELLNEYFLILTSPEEKSLIALEEERMLRLSIKLLERKADVSSFLETHTLPKDIKQELHSIYLDNFYVKYMWIGNNGVKTFEDYVMELKRFVTLDRHPKKILDERESLLQQQSRQKKLLFSKLKFSQKYKSLYESFSKFMITKIYRRFSQIYCIYRMQPILNEIASRLGLSLMQVRFMLTSEIEKALLTGEVNKEELIGRTNLCVYDLEGISESVFTGTCALDKASELEKIYEYDIKEFQGQSACKGKAKGIAKIILRPSDMHKMMQGDILVSIATDPDIVPAMKKAAAIVTEQGGVTSHAAIVARELGIPCVIGTKIATKVIKDGDLIEVDANTGKIKVIETRCDDGREETWVKLLTRENSLLDRSLRAHAYSMAISEIGKASLSKCPVVGKGKVTTLYYKPSDYKLQQSIILKEFSGNNIDPMAERITKYLNDALAWNDFQRKRDIQKSQFKSYLKEFNLHHSHARGAVLYGYYGEPEITRLLKISLQSRVDKSQLDMTLSKLSIPKRLGGQIDSLYSVSDEQQNIRNKTLNSLNLEYKGLEYAEILSYSTAFYELGERVASALFDNFMQKLRSIAGSEIENLEWYDLDSLYDYIDGNNLDDEEIKKRKLSFVLRFEQGKEKVLSGDDSITYIRENFHDDDHKPVSQFSGTIANGGKAIGRVTVVITRDDQKKMRKGDILVSTMTTPRLMDAVTLASAIITDEGGLTAHAAIVARELGIPCLVGTKMATNVLKDGDFVEVDADNGIVRLTSAVVPDSVTDSVTDSAAIIPRPKYSILARDFGSTIVRNALGALGMNMYEREFGVDSPGIALLCENGDITYLVDDKSWASIHDHFVKAIRKNIYLLRGLISKMLEHGKQQSDFTSVFFNSDIKSKTNEEIILHLQKFEILQARLYNMGLVLPILDFEDFSFIEGALREFLNKNAPTEVAETYFQILTRPTELSFLLEQEIDLLGIMAFHKVGSDTRLRELIRSYHKRDNPKIAEKIAMDFPLFYKDLRHHTRKYTWVYFSYSGPAYTEADFLGFIRSNIERCVDPQEEINRIKTEKSQAEAKKLEIIDRLKPDSFNEEIMRISGTVVWAKPRRKEFQSRSYYHIIEGALAEVARRLGLTRKQVIAASIYQLCQALESGSIDKQLLDSQYEFSIALVNRRACKEFPYGSYEIISGDEARDFAKERIIRKEKNDLFTDTAESAGERTIKGTCASPGEAIGIVRIINSPAELSKMNPGDILVAVATNPSVVSAMRIASAIVTDEGGLTCHASIVSRELNIPCVVGTKIATRVLKDGMAVRVNASKGIVTITNGKYDGIVLNTDNKTNTTTNNTITKRIPDLTQYNIQNPIVSNIITKTIKKQSQHYIKNFSELRMTDTAIAGGKGASLGEMTAAGIPIPPGYVILATGFDYYLDYNNLRSKIEDIIKNVDQSHIEAVNSASDHIKQIILDAKMPEDLLNSINENYAELGAEFLAVRSSATSEDSKDAAWAGQLESYLNTQKNELIENVKRCFASLFTPRAIFYRFEKGLNEKHISVAVVVQKMVQSDVSGIAFSVHPISKDRDKILIEAGLGLGEAIVSGEITPDSYVFSKKDSLIDSIIINEQTKMLSKGNINSLENNSWLNIPTEKQYRQKLCTIKIIELAQIILKIEKHYDFPCDIEWAIENDIIYITQSRPITTL